MAFKLRQDVYHAQTRHALLDKSLTVKVEDVVIPLGTSTGAVTNATALLTSSLYVLGVVTGFSKTNLEVISQGQDPSAYTPNTLVTTATNDVTEKYNAVYIPITPEMEFRATLDATAGTTTLSDKPFVWFNLADARTLSESSVVASNSGSAPLQFFSFGLDPEDTTNHTVIGRFAKSIMYQP